MLTRVARALCKEDGKDWNEINDWGKCNYHDLAKAAIEAMREPTDAMMAAGVQTCGEVTFSGIPSWRAMIEAALTSSAEGAAITTK